MTDWLDKEDLMAILPSYIVARILQGTNLYDFSGNPVVPVDELSDRIAMAQLDFDIRDDS